MFWSVPCRYLSMVILGMLNSPHLLCQQGETPSSLNGIPCQGFFPRKGCLGSNPFQYSEGKMSGHFHFTRSKNPGFYQNLGHFVISSWKPSASPNLGPSFQASNQSEFVNPLIPNSMSQPRIPFMVTLHLPDLSNLINNMIYLDLNWPPVPTKLPYDLPKAEGNNGEDLGDHVTMFHLWCSLIF